MSKLTFANVEANVAAFNGTALLNNRIILSRFAFGFREEKGEVLFMLLILNFMMIMNVVVVL